MYLLDTNIFSYIYRQNNQYLIDYINKIPSSQISLCSVVLAELIFGSYNNPALTNTLQKYYTAILTEYICFDFDQNAALKFGELKNTLKLSGKIIDDMDLMIASICLVNDLTLVTNNTKHFINIPNLNLENWVNLE